MSYIYWVTDGRRVKIGLSRNPKTRIRALQTANGRTLSLVALAPGNRAEECRLHTAFATRRTSGEWFRFDSEMRLTAATIGVATPSPTADLPIPNAASARMTTVSSWVLPTHRKRLERIAKAEHRDLSQLVRIAIDEFIQRRSAAA